MTADTENEDQKAPDFYKTKGLIRHMVILPKEYKEKLKQIAKHFRITQGEVVEVFLDLEVTEELGSLFAARRTAKDDAKPDGKSPRSELFKKMKDLTPEQLAAIEAILATK
jgi:hypothetical protein